MQTTHPPLTEKQVQIPSASAHRRAPVRVLYAFDGCTPDCFIRICRFLQRGGYHGDSAAYVMPDTGRFYLSVEEYDSDDVLLPPTALLAEFGVRIAAALLSVCLCEHAKCLCEHGAVEAIAALMI